MFKRGTLVLVPFPFTDLTHQKVRPALIISEPKFSSDSVIVIFISSIVPKKLTPTDVLIQNSDHDFQHTGLKKTSLVRCHKIATIDKRIVLGEIGLISKKVQAKVNKALQAALKL